MIDKHSGELAKLRFGASPGVPQVPNLFIVDEASLEFDLTQDDVNKRQLLLELCRYHYGLSTILTLICEVHSQK